MWNLGLILKHRDVETIDKKCFVNRPRKFWNNNLQTKKNCTENEQSSNILQKIIYNNIAIYVSPMASRHSSSKPMKFYKSEKKHFFKKMSTNLIVRISID